MRKLVFLVAVAAFALSGCGTNPVTGKRELQIVGEATEISIGKQNYVPARQMQGGDYVVEPELTTYLNGVGKRLARVSGRPNLPYEFVVLNNSVPNAWAMPGGKIAINRGLLTELGSEAELAAVVGHEIVHAAARHGAKGMERGMIFQAALLGVQISQADNEYGGYVVGGAQIGAQLISQKYGRDAELESDLYGMRYMKAAGYDPTAAVDLQRTFVRLSEGRRTDFLSGLFASHPPSQDRVDANLETLAQIGAGGDMGRERYQAAIAGIKRAEPAYEAFNEGVKALAQNDVASAARHAQRAIEIQPREGKFYGLYGDTLRKRGDNRGAIGWYQSAIERNPNFFQPYLTRGLALRELGDKSGARRDFEKSIRLLPTAPAYYGLGMLALDAGQRTEAVKYLEMAAGSDSQVGQEASAALFRLEPQRFIKTQLGTDDAGNVLVQVQNHGTLAVANVSLLVRVTDATGQRVVGSKQLTVNQAIGPRQATVLATGIGPLTDASQLQQVNVTVTGATPQ